MEEGFSLKKFLFGKINRKLILIFSILAMLIGVVGSVGYYYVSDIDRIADEIEEKALEALDLEEIRVDLLLQFKELDAYIETGNQEDIKLFHENDAKIEAAFEEAMVLSKNEEEVLLVLKELRDGINKLGAIGLKIIDFIDQGKKEEAIFVELNELGPELERVEALLGAAVQAEKHQLEVERVEADKQTEQAKIVLITLVLAGFLVAIILGVLTSRSISKPIHTLHKATEEVEKGNFEVRVDIKTGDELEQLGKAFNKTTEALSKVDEEHKQVDKAKTEFLSITSHELRSPMTPMKAQLQMLEQEYFGKINQKQKDAVEIVLRNTERLDKIIQDFLEVSRIEAARLKFNFVRTNLIEHIERLVQEMKGFLPEKNIKIEANIGKLPRIEVDPDRVMQVLRNLINNAKKFSKENTKIIVNVELKDNIIELSVEDNGIGIAPENQARVFEPFFQEEQTMYRKYQGTGLGLSICKGIIESQDGKLWVESDLGKGSTFRFTVPLIPVRETRSIKLLFSPKQGIEKLVKELLIEALGPMGESEFNLLKQSGLKYENVLEHLTKLKNQGIIDEIALKNIDYRLISVFEIKEKKINIPETIKKIYFEILGPMGGIEFKRLGAKLDTKTVVLNINQLEKGGILKAADASRFRDQVIGLLG